MLKKVLKWTGILIGSLMVLLLIFYGVVYFKTEARANKIYQVNVQRLTIPSDSASLALGDHIAGVRGCKDCHANGGIAFLNESNPIGVLYASNLTSGKGGINYTDQDYIRALRHGVGKDGKSLWFMPVQHTTAAIGNKDLGALICWLKKMEQVNVVHPQKEMKPLGRVLTFLDKFPMFPAEMINHNASYAEDVPPTVTAAYGNYLAVSCKGCHRENLKGGPSNAPGEPPIPNLTATAHLGKWSSDQFVTTIKTGKTPEGKLLSDYMPWKTMGKAMNDNELKAIYLYLHQLK
jgi:hypothetical protein